MPPPLSRRYTWLAFLVLWAVLALNFKFNAFGIAEPALFDTWQLNGQARVLGGIHADREGLDKDGAILGKVGYAEAAPRDWADPGTVDETLAIFHQGDGGRGWVFEYYRAQFGLQGAVYSFLSRHAGLDTLSSLQTIPAVLTALVLAALFFQYWRQLSPGFALLFLLCLAGAPYFLTMARNLYWSPYLLLAPALAAAWAHGAGSRRMRWVGFGLVGLFMLFKCLSNYEYITSVTLLACAVFVVGPLFRDPVGGRPDWAGAAAVFVACVAAFVVAFLVHASVRGETLVEGIRAIYLEDIARRTYGDASAFSGETGESLRASVLDVLRIYFLDYPGRRTMIVPGKIFLALFGIAFAGLALAWARRDPRARRDTWVMLVYLAVPLSWFVLAKGHSFTQTHINFVLWYLGLMPALIYVAWGGLRSAWFALRRRPPPDFAVSGGTSHGG